MAPIRRSISNAPATKKAPTIKETARVSLFGNSKPGSSSNLKSSTSAQGKLPKKEQREKGEREEKGARSEKEWERDYRELIKESKRKMGRPSHEMKAIQIVLQCVSFHFH